MLLRYASSCRAGRQSHALADVGREDDGIATDWYQLGQHARGQRQRLSRAATGATAHSEDVVHSQGHLSVSACGAVTWGRTHTHTSPMVKATNEAVAQGANSTPVAHASRSGGPLSRALAALLL